MARCPASWRCGFAAVELVATVVLLGLVAVVMAVWGSDVRRRAGLGQDLANLRSFGAATGSYAADNKDLFWGFSWKKGVAYCQYPELNNAASDLQAHGNQAVFLMRTRGGRPQIQPMTGWIPWVYYPLMTVADYLDRPLPDMQAISTGDKNRLLWARDWDGFNAGLYQPAPTTTPPGTNNGKRWPFSASFQIDSFVYDRSDAGQRLSQAGTHANWFVPSQAVLAQAEVSGVAFPSSKVHVHDVGQRHFGRDVYFFLPEARVPCLFVDGSVAVKASGDANPGWQPNNPTSGEPSVFNYSPDVWEPPTTNGLPLEQVTGRYRWTRAGILGRDFGGPEVCTGQPGCK